MADTEEKSERIDVWTTPRTKVLLQMAASSSRKDVAEFLLDAGVHAAQDVLVDRVLFSLDDVQWQAFQDALDRPVGATPHLARLIAEKSILE